MNVQRPGTHIYFCHNVINSKVLVDSLAKLDARTDVSIEPVPCSGRIDPRYILKAFEGGARGVALLTCPVAHCRLLEGNLRAIHRIELAREYLAETGLDPDCVQVFVPSGPEECAIIESIADIGRFVTGKSWPA